MFGKKLKIAPNYNYEKILKQETEKDKEEFFLIADNGKTDYTVVVPKNIAKDLMIEVEHFCEILQKITGVAFAVKNDDELKTGAEIVVSKTSRGTFEEADKDGFIITSDSDSIYIYGCDDETTVFALYTFLEEYLGCMWISSDFDFIPKLPVIKLVPPNKKYNPAIKWRLVHSHEVLYTDWFKKLRFNGSINNSGKNGVKIKGWGTWCHTEWHYVSPEKYYKNHSEYFSRKGDKVGKIHPGREALLCLSNPDVYDIVSEKMQTEIAEKTDCEYWDFSVMDSWELQKGCTCKQCKKQNKKEGSGMGTMLPFINKLAEKFPDKQISTLAYHGCIKPPKSIKPKNNVAIKLCAMPGSQASSYAEGGTKCSNDFKKTLQGWNKISNNIFIWDYVINFKHYALPFPNLAIQQENQKLYEQNNVKGIFHQSASDPCSDCSDIKPYLLSHLMWDGSDFDVQSFLNNYFAVYFGKSAKYIAEYMEKCSEEFYKSQKELGIYDFPIKHSNGYLSKKNIKFYLECFEKAEQTAENDEFLYRVKKAKLPVLYAKMMEFSRDISGKKQASKEFFEIARKIGFKSVTEVGFSVDDFEKYYNHRLNLFEKIPFYFITNHKYK